MGKIHKALEKSKKERQQPQNSQSGSFKYQLKGKKRSIDILDKDRVKSDSQATPDSILGSIHTLLEGTGKERTYEKNDSSLKENVQSRNDTATDNNDPIPTINDDIQKEKEIGDWLNSNDLREPTTEQKNGKVGGRYDEAVATDTSREPQDLVTKKVVSLKNTANVEPAIEAIQGGDHPVHTGKRGTVQPQVETGDSLALHYSIVTLAKPKSFEAEQFKILRANLLFPKKGKPPKTILLTSAVPGEGKTFTAMNLAVSLAQNLNSHVLLVDADIRKPEVHKRFGFGDNIYGLSDFLTQDIPIPSLLVKTPLPNLTILPGGQTTINPSELISSDKMKILLNELSTRYSDRFVIIDAPPPKLASETYALARFVDHIIPVVRSGRSNRELVDEMMNLLGRDKIQGVVLNCYDIRKRKRFGYHKYSEYYSK